jgi:signal transduction histidine kinase/DNA-binding response OmpR family regulator/HAMP domain-containing protein
VDVKGEILELKNTLNVMVDQLNSFASEVTRVARDVGTEGKLGAQAVVRGVGGVWKDLTDNVNFMASNLTSQVRNIAQVTTAVANGDLSKKITVDVKGEILELKNTINTMVDQLNSFASEVTRVAREVGTEGKLGGQAEVKGVGGVWKDLTDNVNSMASNLTSQVRGIARIVTAVANGDLKRKLTVETKGEIAALADTINEMIDTLATFADQVTTVAREVGTEGKLGGQASVPGAAGLWKDLTDNVNQLAANLTNQVRAIAEVATAVTKGDLTRSINVEALGEVASLKDNINEMIRNLKDTTQKNMEQDWLKTNLAEFTNKLQGQKNLTTVANLILSELVPLVNAQQGVFYINEPIEGEPFLKLLGGYAFRTRKGVSNAFKAGEGLVGQCALEKERIVVTNVPPEYIQISSGLGSATPYNILVLPILFEEEVKAVIELASFNRYSDIHVTFLDQLKQTIGIVLNTIAANMRTEDLLKQSQALTAELQAQQHELKTTNERLERQAETLRKSEELLRQQQEELRRTNEQLEEKANLLANQNTQVETKNREVEEARLALEEKAAQLALSSKYKSEFLANMSHELRTPLNSLLILSKLLSDNREETLTPKQVEFAQTIYASGSDLLALINDILDLAKIESGTMGVSISPVGFAELTDYVDRTFREVAQNKRLSFEIERIAGLPSAIQTDGMRLQQVLKNLLSNAIKFTEQGRVGLRIEKVVTGWDRDHIGLNQADCVLAFSVTDTGIGISPDKLRIIFEAFQQADGTTSRKYGGTGLGLSISREIARLLGGEITVSSTPGQGSTFTFFLPRVYSSSTVAPRPSAPVLATRRAEVRAVPLLDEPTLEYVEADVPTEVPDDRGTIQAEDRVLLIVEDDAPFANILLDLAREKGMKGLVASNGEAGLGLARRFKPAAITLDLCLPDKDGWTILDRLKHDPITRHIPVHIISVEEARQRGLRLGAFGYLSKPVSREWLEKAFDEMIAFLDRPSKNLLIVEDNADQRQSMMELIAGGDVHATSVGSGEEALNALKHARFDCMVLDLRLPDMDGKDLIERIHTELGLANLPIIVYTGKELTHQEENELVQMTEAIIIKDVKSPERLLDETALFLHRSPDTLGSSQRQLLDRSRQSDPILAGKKILIVDDDIRNIFALTSILEQHHMQAVYAENGFDGIEKLTQHPDFDIVLMDIMMPEMDGYQTMHAIRKMPEFASLPIIAVTAKAMKVDRTKCIEAGASDYLSKPVDPDQLLSLLRVWLYR